MAIDITHPSDAAQATEQPAIWDRLPVLLMATAIIGAILAGAAVYWVLQPSTPGSDSVEAGFARDMSTHHNQAVEMALIIRDTTANDEIRVLATDIILTQQAQIGIMRGWLEVWDLPLNGEGAPMAWADMSGHDMEMTDGLMAGMASADEIAALREMTGAEADREFLRLMIAHHQGGVMMANAALDSTDNDDVERLAGSIVNGQQVEIELMETLLAQIESAG